MDKTLIEDTQKGINQEDGKNQEDAEAHERCLVSLSLALEAAGDGGRQGPAREIFHLLDRVAQGHAGRQSETQRYRWKLPGVVHGQRPQTLSELRDGVERDQLPFR